jgi:hypothetical protein
MSISPQIYLKLPNLHPLHPLYFKSEYGTYSSPLASDTRFAALAYPSLFCNLLTYAYNLGKLVSLNGTRRVAPSSAKCSMMSAPVITSPAKNSPDDLER